VPEQQAVPVNNTVADGVVLADLRLDYGRASLTEHDVLDDPIAQFGKWFEEALHAKVNEPNAMSVATVDADGKPSSRIVLIKQYDHRASPGTPITRARKAGNCAPTRTPRCYSSGVNWNARCASKARWCEPPPRKATSIFTAGR
jgi:hypothetical protein